MLFISAKALSPAPITAPLAAYHLLAGVVHLLLAQLVEEVRTHLWLTPHLPMADTAPTYG